MVASTPDMHRTCFQGDVKALERAAGSEAAHDPDVDVVGVIFVDHLRLTLTKFYVSRRLGQMVESMGVDGIRYDRRIRKQSC